MKKSSQNRPWQKISSRRIYHCAYLDLYKDQVLNPLGRKTNYYYIKKNPFVAIIPEDKNGKLWLVRQYRYTLRKYTWEFPMGHKNSKKETYLNAAKRELSEEACLSAQKWTTIGISYISETVLPQYSQIYLAQNLKKIDKIPDPSEISEVKKFSLKEIQKMIIENKIVGSPTLALLCKYYLHKKIL